MARVVSASVLADYRERMKVVDAESRSKVERLVTQCVRDAKDEEELPRLLIERCGFDFEQYCDAAAVISSSFYDACRTSVIGSGFETVSVSHYRDEEAKKRFESAVYSFVKKADGDESRLVKLMSDRMSYELKVSSSYSMTANGLRDDKKPRFMRVPGGTETCAFCLMLASRGAAYTSAQNAGEGNHFHGNCDCAVVPCFNYKKVRNIWTTNEIEGYNPSSSTDKAIGIAKETLSNQELDYLLTEYGLKRDDIAKKAVSSFASIDSVYSMKRFVEQVYAGDYVIKSNNAMSPFEKSVVTSAINNVYHVKYAGEESGDISFADFVYKFLIAEFNEYKFVRKRRIE